MITTAQITTTDFRSFFVRDFDYGTVGAPMTTCQDQIFDSDINKAFAQSSNLFPAGIWATDDEFKIAYLFMSAHFLVKDIQGALQGTASTATLPVASRSVGSVSESYDIPEWAKKSPIFSLYLTTSYGLRYLMMVKPKCIGGVSVQTGTTTPF